MLTRAFYLYSFFFQVICYMLQWIVFVIEKCLINSFIIHLLLYLANLNWSSHVHTMVIKMLYPFLSRVQLSVL